MVHVLDEDPDLGRHLAERDFRLARLEAIAPLLQLPNGNTPFLVDEPTTRGHLGLVVLDGLIARHVMFGEIGATEFLGVGDLLRPWVKSREGIEAAQVRWEVLMPTRLASLDREFAQRVRHWPEITSALLDRYAERSDSQLLQSALRQAKRVDDRVLLALWHFAGRWGQVGAEGRIVHIPNITGEVLARIVGARRQSVSTALGLLASRGALRRRPDGSWVLPHQPPQLAHIELGHRASDRAPGALRVSA